MAAIHLAHRFSFYYLAVATVICRDRWTHDRPSTASRAVAIRCPARRQDDRRAEGARSGLRPKSGERGSTRTSESGRFAGIGTHFFNPQISRTHHEWTCQRIPTTETRTRHPSPDSPQCSSTTGAHSRRWPAEWDALADDAIEGSPSSESWMLLPALRHLTEGNAVKVLLIRAAIAGEADGGGKLCGVFPFEVLDNFPRSADPHDAPLEPHVYALPGATFACRSGRRLHQGAVLLGGGRAAAIHRSCSSRNCAVTASSFASCPTCCGRWHRESRRRRDDARVFPAPPRRGSLSG